MSAYRQLSEFNGMPVDVGDREVGRVDVLILDPVEQTLLGFLVRATSGRSYFLPLALASVPDGRVAVASSLHLVDAPEHYRSRGRPLDWRDAAGSLIEPLSGRITPEPRGPAEEGR